MRAFTILACFLSLTLSGCGQNTQPPPAEASPAIAMPSGDLDALEKLSQSGASPYAGLPDVPLSTDCLNDDATCDANRLQMLQNWPQAWAGDLQAQRNVAALLSNPSAGIASDPVQGCAWRQVILDNSPTPPDPSDSGLAATECGRLNDDDRTAADAAARNIGDIRDR